MPVIINQLNQKASLSDSTLTNLSQRFTYKMAAKTSWNRHGTKYYYVTVTLCIHRLLSRLFFARDHQQHCVTVGDESKCTRTNVPVKGKVFPYSLPSVGAGADPGVQAVSPQVT